VIEAATIALLAERLNLPPRACEGFAEVEAATRSGRKDCFGRTFAGRPPLSPPFKAVKVTGRCFTRRAVLRSTARLVS